MFKAASYVGAKLCRPGDIVINTLWAWMAALGASKHTGIVSPAYGVYRPHTPASFNPAYLDYLLRTHAYVAEYIGRSTGIRASRLRLYPSQFLDIPLIQPACDEQDQIVSYLRVQDANIGQFVRAKRAQITLLIEQKLRIIDEAVAQGVDSTVGFKSSGIDWIGKIPEHWSVVRLRNLVESITSGSRGWSDYASDEGPLFLRVGNLSRGALNLKLKKTVRLQLPEETRVEGTRTRVREGDILLSITAFIGSVGLVPADLGEAYVSQHVARCRLRKGAANPKWVAFVLLSRIGQAHGSICMYGGTKQGLSLSDVKNYVVVLPPRQEQDDLVAQIEAQIAVLDRAIEAGRNEIDRVREYHDRLVWDAVTGQIDLRTWQPGPDDFVTEEDLAALGDDDENETTEETDGDD
jgi:type I restriction enzyme S subunit